MAEGHHHGAIHEEEDSEDGEDFERFKNVFEMGRQIWVYVMLAYDLTGTTNLSISLFL